MAGEWSEAGEGGSLWVVAGKYELALSISLDVIGSFPPLTVRWLES